MSGASRQPRRIDGLLDQFFRTSGLGMGSRFDRIRRAFDAAVQGTSLERACVAGFQRGTLTIEVADSALLAEAASFGGDDLLARINQLLEQSPGERERRPIRVDRLRFRLRGMGHL